MKDPALWLAAHKARRSRIITAGALGFLYQLAKLAQRRGDGRSVTIGERTLSRITGEHRSAIQRYKSALQVAGLIERTKIWAGEKEGWFWQETITLKAPLPATPGPKIGPRETPPGADLKQVRSPGPKKSPSLNGTKPRSEKKNDGGGLRPGAGLPAKAPGEGPATGGTRPEKAALSEEGGTPPLAPPHPSRTDDAKAAEAKLDPQTLAELRCIEARNRAKQAAAGAAGNLLANHPAFKSLMNTLKQAQNEHPEP